jgi:hypothetical protein
MGGMSGRPLRFRRFALRSERDEIATRKSLAQLGLMQTLERERRMATSESFTKENGAIHGRQLTAGGTAVGLFTVII